MNLKSIALALLALAAFTAAAFVGVSASRADGQRMSLGGPIAPLASFGDTLRKPIVGTGTSTGVMPTAVHEYRARTIAIQRWSQQAAQVYGVAYSGWSPALDKDVRCTIDPDKVTCMAIGIPSASR